MNEYALSVVGLVKQYGDRTAVRGLTFDLARGEILGLVGPNGAGKTTSMRSVAGIFPPTAGRISVAGHDVRESPVEAKRRLALVPDDPNLFSNLTVQEHLEFWAQVHDLKGDWRARAAALLDQLDMAPRAGSPAADLSRGMRQKVAIACAFLHEPALLMLDEPLTGLDPRGIRTLYDMLRGAAARGAGVIVSSHLLSQIEGLCTRFLILRGGEKIAFGTKDDLHAQLPQVPGDATLEELFFLATEGRSGGAASPPDLPAA